MYFHISRRFWNFQSLCTAWCKHHWNTHISLTCSDLHITAPQLPDVRGKLFTLSSHLQFSFISKSVRFPFKQLCRWTISNKDRSLSQISKSPGLHFFSNQIFSYWKQRYKLCNQTAGTRNGTKMSCAALSASCRISASDVQASKAKRIRNSFTVAAGWMGLSIGEWHQPLQIRSPTSCYLSTHSGAQRQRKQWNISCSDFWKLWHKC